MQQIDRGIYYENSYAGVTLGAIVLPHGIVLIDAPLRAEDGKSWKAVLNTLGGNANRLLVNLDVHPDRTLGARVMECTIVAHQKTAQVFRGRPSIFKGQNADSGSEWETYDEAVGTRWAIPDITFTHNLILHWGAPDIVLEQHPGPNPGSIWVVIPANKIVFVGDTILADQPPFLANADISAWIESIDVLLDSYQGYKIISGRGGPVSFEAVRAQKTHLKHIFKELDLLVQPDTPPEIIDKLIPGLLKDLKFPSHMEEQYIQRLRHGLTQYHFHRYRPNETNFNE